MKQLKALVALCSRFGTQSCANKSLLQTRTLAAHCNGFYALSSQITWNSGGQQYFSSHAAPTVLDIDLTPLRPESKQSRLLKSMQLEAMVEKAQIAATESEKKRAADLPRLLKRLQGATDADVVIRTLRRILPPCATILRDTDIMLCIQSFMATADPQTVLTFFNSYLGVRTAQSTEASAASSETTANNWNPKINSEHVSALFKVMTTNLKGQYRLFPTTTHSHKRGGASSPGAAHIELVLETLQWYHRLIDPANQSHFHRRHVPQDLIFAQAALSLCASVDRAVTQQPSPAVDKLLSEALKILNVVTQTQVTLDPSQSHHLTTRTHSLSPDVVCMLYTPVIILAGKCAHTDVAQRLFDELCQIYGINTVSATALMTAYNQNSEYERAQTVYAQLMQAHTQQTKAQSQKAQTQQTPAAAQEESKPTSPLLSCWPSDRTMYAYLYACVYQTEPHTPTSVLKVLNAFGQWNRRRPDSKEGLDWLVAEMVARLTNLHFEDPDKTAALAAVASSSADASNNDDDNDIPADEPTPTATESPTSSSAKKEPYWGLLKTQLSLQRYVVNALVRSRYHTPRMAPHGVWAALAPAFACQGNMEMLYSSCEVTEKMLLAMATQMAQRGRYREAISLLERSQSYNYSRAVSNALLASAMVASFKAKQASRVKTLYSTYTHSNSFAVSDLASVLSPIHCVHLHDDIASLLK